MFIFNLLFLAVQCFAGPGYRLFNGLSCDVDREGCVETMHIRPGEEDAAVFKRYRGGYGLCSDGKNVDSSVKKDVDASLEASRSWDSYELDISNLFPPDPDTGVCRGMVLPSVGFTEQAVIDSNNATLDELQENYPDAFYVSCLRGGIPIQEASRRRGLNVHLGVLSSRDVTEQRTTVCDFDMIPWDKVKECGNTIVFWDDITDTGQTAADFLYWCLKNKKLEGGVKVVLAFNYGKDSHPHKKGEVSYGGRDGVQDATTMKTRIIRRLAELACVERGVKLTADFVTSADFAQGVERWADFFEDTVEEAFFTEYLNGKWVVFPAEGGNPLVNDKPDISVLDPQESYDALLGFPLIENDKDRMHVLTQEALLSNILDEELVKFTDSGYVFVDEQNVVGGVPRVAYKYRRDVSQRILCYPIVAGYERELKEFAEQVRSLCGYKSIQGVECTSKEVFRPYPLWSSLRKHKTVRNVFRFHSRGSAKAETLRKNGESY